MLVAAAFLLCAHFLESAVLAYRLARVPKTLEPLTTQSLYTFNMATGFRCAMMWLLLFALPLQGFAAATMVNCGPNHHQTGDASVSTQVNSSEQAGHSHQHFKNVADSDEVAVVGDPADGGSSLDHLNKLSKSKCSACAACCMGVALPASPLAFPSFSPASVPTPSASASHVDFVSNGLDRPPRLFLA